MRGTSACSRAVCATFLVTLLGFVNDPLTLESRPSLRPKPTVLGFGLQPQQQQQQQQHKICLHHNPRRHSTAGRRRSQLCRGSTRGCIDTKQHM
ncbi:hypothetical protein ABBQ32_009948 [Trebouxia sp. C0010 RCD-2024]